MIKVIKSFSSIINNWEILKYDFEGNSFRFIAKIQFIDSSILNIKEYYFEKDSKRKYSYHWMNSKNELIIRWDNSEHWQEITTFPYHEHHKTISNVKSSRTITLQEVLTTISSKF